jgi:hypothetical protein
VTFKKKPIVRDVREVVRFGVTYHATYPERIYGALNICHPKHSLQVWVDAVEKVLDWGGEH